MRMRKPVVEAPTTEIVAEAEPGLVKQESSGSIKEGHDTLES